MNLIMLSIAIRLDALVPDEHGNVTLTLTPERAKELSAFIRHRVDLQQTFDLRWKADMRAIKMWQADHPGNDLVWPDRADLVVWLLGQMEILRGVVDEFMDGTITINEARIKMGLKPIAGPI